MCVRLCMATLASPTPAGYILSLGYLIIALVTVPLSYIALDSNIIFQIVGGCWGKEGGVGGGRGHPPHTPSPPRPSHPA